MTGTSPKLKVCYLVTHGFAARMVLQSDLVPELARRGAQVTVLCPSGIDRELRQIEQPGILEFCSGNFEVSKLTHGQMAELRRYFREPIRDNPALWSRHQFYRHSNKRWIRWRADLFLIIHRLFYRSRLVNRTFGWIDRRFHRSRTLAEQLKQIKPDMVVSTYPVSTFETSGLLEARHLGIKTVGHLLSWDNITSKGRFVVNPDYFVSWGPIMSEELGEHYHVPRERIFECGVPHFDGHLKLVDREYGRQVLKGLGLDPIKPFLFFGMSSPIFAPREVELMERLSRDVSNNVFGTEMQLVIRPHPQNVTGHYADHSWLPRLEKLRSDRVGLNLPMLAEGKLAWNMEQEDLKVLVNLLSGASVSMNSGSTLSIDALMHDKPVVVAFFDADERLPWWQSARRVSDYHHYRKLLETRGVRPVFDYHDLVSAVSEYLADPSLDRQFRHRAIERECGSPDGSAAGRVAAALVAISKDIPSIPVSEWVSRASHARSRTPNSESLSVAVDSSSR